MNGRPLRLPPMRWVGKFLSADLYPLAFFSAYRPILLVGIGFLSDIRVVGRRIEARLWSLSFVPWRSHAGTRRVLGELRAERFAGANVPDYNGVIEIVGLPDTCSRKGLAARQVGGATGLREEVAVTAGLNLPLATTDADV